MRLIWSAVMSFALLSGTLSVPMQAGQCRGHDKGSDTITPIKHLVVIFDENNSFDHYFGTYPYATNPVGAGEPPFYAAPDTPPVNGLLGPLTPSNLNEFAPFRLDRSMAVTCDNDNHYTDEQKAYDAGLLDKFVQDTSNNAAGCTPGLAMGYYDGNTVTALWNYAQHYAMSDNFYDTEFGTTVMGHLNLISGLTHQTSPTQSVKGKIANGSIIANVDPVMDDCASGTEVQMTSLNVGDLLNNKGITWGWFYGDFAPTVPVSATNASAQCSSEYDSHYDPFLYYASTSNPHHLLPSSTAMIGQTDQANHQYDLNSFWAAVTSDNLPAVSFVKPPHVMNGHPADSSPLLEQEFLVNTINQLQQSPFWKDMAILITYDDSDGWYDHVMPPIVSQSNDAANDALLGPTGLCGTPAPGAYLDRCGYGERLPFLVISPYAKHNYVDHSVNDLTSILRFIEDNWSLGRIGDQSFDAIAGTLLGMFDFDERRARRTILDPDSGEVIRRDE
jgi:phospholipase C